MEGLYSLLITSSNMEQINNISEFMFGSDIYVYKEAEYL